MRLPNVFTAIADVAMGFLFAQVVSGSHDAWLFGLLAGASCLLYTSGMVLNDVFDLTIDTRERPGRALPSGRISVTAAKRLGWTLLALGVAMAVAAAFVANQPRPAVVGGLLAVCIVLYDGPLKRTPVGPIAMGGCRMLNVLLGMSVASGFLAEHWLVAGGIGTYIAGVTWFARTEARASNRPRLVGSVGVMLVGIGLLAWFPSWTDDVVPLIRREPERWYLMMAALGALIAYRCLWAVVEPVPARVQMAVKHCIMSLIVLDAAVCCVVRGLGWAVAILLLLAPAMFLGRWIRST